MNMSTLSIEEKRAVYTGRIQILRQNKIEETKKKLAFNGYMDEDDYNDLVPPEGYNWRPKATHANGDFHGYKGWSENFRDMVATFPPVVVRESSMAGNYFRILHKFRKLRWHPDWDFEIYKPFIEKYGIDHGLGQVHHFCGDVRIGLELGWGGLLNKVLRYATINNKAEEQREFYNAKILFLETCIGWMEKTTEGIQKALDSETDPLIHENLEGMLASNQRVTLNPPRTLRETCQFISWYNIFGRSFNREGAGGQLDELLRPYYEKDKAAGLIDNEDAIYFIAGLLMSDTKYYQLGGPDGNGKDMVSDVSWLILEAADRLNVSANLTIRVHDGLDRNFFRRGVELLFKNKNAWPRFSGDQSLVDGFVRRGFTKELARKRIAVGCNWMALPGIEYPLNDSIKVNFAKIFEVAYYDMIEKEKDPSTDLLFSYFEKHLRIVMKVVADTTDMHLRLNHYNSPELFLNLVCDGPIEKGRDASDKSMQYYNIGVDGSGIAVAADSFAALEQRIEREKCLDWTQVTDVLRSNYDCENGSYIRFLLKNSEKYGQWNSAGDRWAVKISKLFTDITVNLNAEEGEIFIPGLFSWSKTITFGKIVGATPDGRLSGEPINHGANPMPGSVKSGAMTTMSESIAAVQCGMGNTCPFQMELDPGITTSENGVEKVMALLETHLKRGGTLINVNIVDAEKIRAAHKNPELFPDLVVRVTGFTAYFITLSPEFRQLVVDRLVEAN